MAGSATLTDDPMNGVRNEASVVTKRTDRGEDEDMGNADHRRRGEEL
jgi:hypothetical protein